MVVQMLKRVTCYEHGKQMATLRTFEKNFLNVQTNYLGAKQKPFPLVVVNNKKPRSVLWLI